MTLRAPTPFETLYAWWRAAVRQKPDDREDVPNEPRCGWFKRRMVRGGVYVPARIWVLQECGDDGELLDDETLQCEVNGKWADPEDAWSYICGHPITVEEYNYLEAARVWAETYSPDDPFANPRRKIDHLTTPILF